MSKCILDFSFPYKGKNCTGFVYREDGMYTVEIYTDLLDDGFGIEIYPSLGSVLNMLYDIMEEGEECEY